MSDDKPTADDHGPDDGWQQYRKWLSHKPTPRPDQKLVVLPGRTGRDPDLYSWQGYHEWMSKIKHE